MSTGITSPLLGSVVKNRIATGASISGLPACQVPANRLWPMQSKSVYINWDVVLLFLMATMLRHGLCGNFAFSLEDRSEKIRRIGEMIKLFLEAGVIALSAFISSLRIDRQRIRGLIGADNFIEIYCHCPLEVCEERDVKGLYQKARKGEIKNYTGISALYEEPLNPDLRVDTSQQSLDYCVKLILAMLAEKGLGINIPLALWRNSESHELESHWQRP